MDDNVFLIFGYLASGTACFMMFPQIYLTTQKKRIEDLSITTISMGLLTQCLFFPYSIHFQLYPLLTVNIFFGVFDTFIIAYYFYLKYNRDEISKDLLHEFFRDSEQGFQN